MKSALSKYGIEKFAARLLKVNHAGENGAVAIYSRQIFFARLTAPAMVAELIEFRVHEMKHRDIFWKELQRRDRPRCKSFWLCGVGGFTLGLVTGAFGRRAIAATTVAVERVVLRHLEHQLALLDGKDAAATGAIESIVVEERQHHDSSASHIARDRFWTRILSPLVAAATESVIWIGMRA
jgi:ubiquinone biosynthesis monooxygenase Coq7